MSTPSFVHRSIRSRPFSGTRAASITADGIAYALVLGGIYLLLGTLWFMSAKEKLIDDNGTAPAGLHRMFSGTFISSFPGTDAAWVILGILEALAFVVVAASLLRGEFLPHRPKPILLAGIAGSMAIFAILAFGDIVAANNTGTASLFGYFAATGVLLVIVLLLPPYRPTAWLSRLFPESAGAGAGVRKSALEADDAPATQS